MQYIVPLWEIYKNTQEVREALAFASCFSALLSCSLKFPRAYNLTMHSARFLFL